MHEVTCEFVRDSLPGYAAGSLADRRRIERHLESCSECSAELRLVERIRESRAEPPGELLARLQHAVRRPHGRGRRLWLLPVAAAIVLALGTRLFWRRAAVDVGSPGDLVAAEALPSLWPSGDGAVADVPLLDELSEDALRQLLDDLEG